MQGEHPLPEGVIEQFSKTNGQLCKDVFLLSETTGSTVLSLIMRLLTCSFPGKSAVVTTTEGLRIACIGGTYKATVYNGSEIPHVRVHSRGDSKRRNHCRAFHPLISRHKPSRNCSPTPFPPVLLAPHP